MTEGHTLAGLLRPGQSHDLAEAFDPFTETNPVSPLPADVLRVEAMRLRERADKEAAHGVACTTAAEGHNNAAKYLAIRAEACDAAADKLEQAND